MPARLTMNGEFWIEQAYGVQLKPAPMRRGFMLKRPHPELGEYINIRSITHGALRPQLSMRGGIHRDAVSTRDDMMHDTSIFDTIVVIDGKSAPDLMIYPIPTPVLLNFMDEDGVDKAGISRSRFNKFLRENFRIRIDTFNYLDTLGRQQPAPLQDPDDLQDGLAFA